jgi:antitoxin VapB
MAMNKPVQTRTFKSGNSIAVRLPKSFDIPAGAEVEVSKAGNRVTIQLARDDAEAKRRMIQALDALKALPKPPRIEKREPIEFPDRRGL